MAKASAAFPWQLVLIGDLAIDCTTSEKITHTSEVTEYPVESGSVISDNVQAKPLVIELDCIVSNTPIGEAMAIRLGKVSATADNGTATYDALNKFSSTVYEDLVNIQAREEFVTLRTSQGKFPRMILKHLGVPRDDKTGDALHFTATFQQVTVIENVRGKRVAVPGASGGGKGANTLVDGSGPLIRREIAYTFLNGRAVTVWFDQRINLWRQHAYKAAAKTVTTKKIDGGEVRLATPIQVGGNEWTFVNGPLLDGFSAGTLAQLITYRDAAYNAAPQGASARWKRLMLDSYTNNRDTASFNIGRNVTPTGKPAFPETIKESDKGTSPRAFKDI